MIVMMSLFGEILNPQPSGGTGTENGEHRETQRSEEF